MKCIRVCILLLFAWAGASGPAPLRAQSNPPFQNPALDSNCYFPQIGDPSEMDTIMGSRPNQYLGGSIIKNLGPKPDGSPGNMFIGNISPSVALAQVATGRNFNLHQMKEYVQNFDPNILSNGNYHLGHFRDRSHLDIFTSVTNVGWAIYWADDNGNYDSTRYTVLKMNIPSGPFKRINQGPIIPWYVTHLTSDTVDDIVVSGYNLYPNDADTAYVLLYRGGSTLYGKDTASEDTSAFLYPFGHGAFTSNCTQADFRGVGRDDLMVDSLGFICYFKNDPPFSLQKFAQAVTEDTFFSGQQYHEETGDWVGWNLPSFFTMPALPKAIGDKSVDFVPTLTTSNGPDIGIFFFRGGPDFGARRLRPDSAAFVILSPAATGLGSNYLWPYSIADAGDMTGTGNRVLYTAGAYSNDAQTDNFYVTGKALDDKIDIYNVSNSGSQGDTLTANADSMEDFMLSRVGGIGSGNYGTLWLYYGSNQIPVHLNPQWSDVKNIPTEDGVALTLSPNPAQTWSVATIVWPEAEDAEYEVYNILGNVMQSGNIRMLGGAEQERIYFPNLASGVYEVLIHGESHEARARLVIAR